MRRACKITAAARALAGEMVRPGVTTKAIDKAVHDFIVSQGATPSFLHYSGYPASVCISVNNTVIHGIPDGRVLQEGDIVSVDVGAKWQGFHGDCAATYACGVVRDFVGHGVGEHLHEEPEVPNYGKPGRGPRLIRGMVIAIEPMINAGTFEVRVLKDGWTTVTADGSLSAHYENTVLITDGEPEILTVAEGL